MILIHLILAFVRIELSRARGLLRALQDAVWKANLAFLGKAGGGRFCFICSAIGLAIPIAAECEEAGIPVFASTSKLQWEIFENPI